MKRTIIAVVVISSLLASCEKDVNNVKLPEFVQKLVVNSFISPRDTLSYVYVSSNKRLYGNLNASESIGNVTAVMSDGTHETELTRIDEGFIFRPRDMMVEEGKTYSLKVSSSKGLEAEASVTIPWRRPVKIEIDTVLKYIEYDNSGMGWYERTAEVYVSDYAGENNYYAFAYKQIIYNSDYPYYPYHLDYYQSFVFNDKGMDGERLFVGSFSYMDTSRDDSSDLVVYILQTDREYNTYHKSLDKYSSGQDPFTEISPAYSNINGGLGIFASYVVDSLVLKVK